MLQNVTSIIYYLLFKKNDIIQTHNQHTEDAAKSKFLIIPIFLLINYIKLLTIT